MFKARINAPLESSIIETMHERALEILQEIGIKVSEDRVLRRIENIRGFKIEDGWVKIDSALMETLIEENRMRMKGMGGTEDAEEVILSIHPYSTHILDPETDEIRPLTTQDLIASTKLIDSLYDWGVRGTTPGAPQDVPPGLDRILQCKIGYEYSRTASHRSGSHTGPPFENYYQAKYIQRMAEALGQKMHFNVYVISPLKLEGMSIDYAIPYFEEGACEGVHVVSMPLAGATAPVYPIGAFTQCIAETFGGYAILHEAYPNIPIHPGGIGAYHFDMKYGNIVFGSPEQVLMDLIGIAVNRFYGVERVHGVRSLRTMAKKVDVQAQVEKAASAAVGVLTGPGAFIHSGGLSLDEVFSPIQLIMDCEIGRYLSRLAKGLSFSEEELDISMDVIRRGAQKGTFLAERTSLIDHKKLYWYPDLFDYSLLHTSRGQMKSITDRAKDIISKRVAEHDFILEEDKRRKLDEIYQEAIRNLPGRP